LPSEVVVAQLIKPPPLFEAVQQAGSVEAELKDSRYGKLVIYEHNVVKV
jgi:hypothetical protein